MGWLGSAPKAPEPPDPVATAQAQGVINKETAETQAALNRINEYNPYGSVVYGRVEDPFNEAVRPPAPVAPVREDFMNRGNVRGPVYTNNDFRQGTQSGGGAGFDQAGWDSANRAYQTELDNYNKTSGGQPPAQYQRTITLHPEEQKALDAQRARDAELNRMAMGQLGRIDEATSTPLDFSGARQITALDDKKGRQRVEDALARQYGRRLNPIFNQRERELENKLANQGITLGSDAWKEAMTNFGRERNDAYNSANNQIILGGGAEQSRLFGLESTQRQQDIQEIMARRNQPINEFSAMTGLSNGVATPQFAQPGQVGVAAPDLVGLSNMAYQGQMNNYNQQLQSRNSGLGGIFGLAGSVASALPWGKWF